MTRRKKGGSRKQKKKQASKQERKIPEQGNTYEITRSNTLLFFSSSQVSLPHNSNPVSDTRREVGFLYFGGGGVVTSVWHFGWAWVAVATKDRNIE